MTGFDFSDVLDHIKDLYKKKGIECLFIMDQINTLTSKFTISNLITQNKKPKTENEQLFLTQT